MSIDGPKKSRGRPAVDSEAVKVRLQRADLDLIDRWIAANEPGASRPEAVRRIIRSLDTSAFLSEPSGAN